MSTSESPEYQLIVKANNYAVEVDNEVLLVHKASRGSCESAELNQQSQFVKDHYAPRFLELEQFLPLPADYCRAVLKIGNPEDLDNINAQLLGMIPSAVLMVVVLTASQSSGRQLSEAEWTAVKKACEMATFLEKAKIDVRHHLTAASGP